MSALTAVYTVFASYACGACGAGFACKWGLVKELWLYVRITENLICGVAVYIGYQINGPGGCGKDSGKAAKLATK